jgi:ribosomal protein L16 Arg81 hydroxylase
MSPDNFYVSLPNEKEIGVMNFDLFDWNTAIENFQASVDHRKTWEFKHWDTRAVRVATAKEEFNDVNLPSLASHNAELIPQVDFVKKLIEEKHLIQKSKHRVNCHLFMSFVEESEGLEWHCDTENTYIWQVIGTTKWQLQIGPDESSDIEEFILEPNDMIYIPKHWHHKPTITGPRVSVSFSIEEFIYEGANT